MDGSNRYVGFIVVVGLAMWGCGQEDVVFPDSQNGGAAGMCGPWYPGGGEEDGDGGTDSVYGIEEGKVFPCLVWESVRFGGADTYLNIGEEYLKAKNGLSETKALVIVVSAEHCPSCATLISALATRKDDFQEGSPLMIGMARRDLQGLPDDPDFSLDKAEQVLLSERWQGKEWFVTNDAEDYLDTVFDVGTPWIVVVEMKTMIVRSRSNEEFSPDGKGVEKLLSLIESF